MNAGQLLVDGIGISLSNTGKPLYADEGITKGDLIEYFRDMAPRILPYLRDRPLVMGRYPDGVTGESIIQKNVPRYFPDWVNRAEVKKRGGAIQQVICDKPATLVYLANQACIELHMFLSRVDSLDTPDQVVFDLDPPDGDHFDVARRCALTLRRLLEDELGLVTYVKTTGGKGLHVHVPLRPDDEFDPVRDFARDVAELIAANAPDELTTEQRIQNRGQRLYLDIMRNSYAQMVVAPYSPRARAGATVATPLHWDELDDPGLSPREFTMRTIGDRLARVSDPWEGMARHRHRLAGARRQLDSLKRLLPAI